MGSLLRALRVCELKFYASWRLVSARLRIGVVFEKFNGRPSEPFIFKAERELPPPAKLVVACVDE